MIDIDLIAGARPNFIKISAIFHAIQKYNLKCNNPIKYRLIHTGQHFDKNMSGKFFEQLSIRTPDVNFEIGGGNQAEQKGKIMTEYEKLLILDPAKICVVVGDVNSTAACSIAAVKLGVKVAHVEAGIRSYDRKMPEEINRLLTDSISDYFFTTSVQANLNLINSGISIDNIYFVGNTMIDTLLRFKSNFSRDEQIFEQIGNSKFLLLTMHRPSNVDDLTILESLMDTINGSVPDNIKIVFPVHPRTKKVLELIKYKYTRFIWVEPLPYFSFMYLLQHAAGIITDSGGVTEESTVLGIPCITLRDSTERPETVDIGTNVLVGNDRELLINKIIEMCSGQWKASSIPENWDGNTGDRIIEILANILNDYSI